VGPLPIFGVALTETESREKKMGNINWGNVAGVGSLLAFGIMLVWFLGDFIVSLIEWCSKGGEK